MYYTVHTTCDAIEVRIDLLWYAMFDTDWLVGLDYVGFQWHVLKQSNKEEQKVNTKYTTFNQLTRCHPIKSDCVWAALCLLCCWFRFDGG